MDISNLLAGQGPTQQQTAAVRQECLETGFLALEGHGLQEELLLQLFAAAERFFDLSLDDKMQLVVQVDGLLHLVFESPMTAGQCDRCQCLSVCSFVFRLLHYC
jgi:isopenicillin N synthase-like dioxygenase